MSNTTKPNYTPGPWKMEEHNGSYEIWSHNTKIAVINEMHNVDQYPGRDMANAAIISAAPNLLMSLERLLHNYVDADDQNDPYIIEARAAIAKAKGKS